MAFISQGYFNKIFDSMSLLLLWLNHGQALLLDSDLAPLFQFKWTSWGLLLGTQITPRGWIFWTIFFQS